ncbi:MAG: hypothetical protein HF978_14310 [Desulfobacteraceae bacterium]|nr:hypothetical protein [Desulfobacteraceae bacterium]MBC2756712.1 hypothetical protein [Desulfobacteraceae bacterium]
MVSFQRFVIIVCFLMVACFCVLSCSEKKEGKVIVKEPKFSIRQDAEFNWVINAKGKIRNVGDVDVKKVVVTGYCRSCGEVLTAGVWFVNRNMERTSEQKDVISYLTAGDEEEFSFKEVAFYFNQVGEAPEDMPDNLEIVIESFEVVDK